MVHYFIYLILSEDGTPASFLSTKDLELSYKGKKNTTFNYFGHSTVPEYQAYGLGDYLRKFGFFDHVKEKQFSSMSSFFYLSTNIFLFMNVRKMSKNIPLFNVAPLDPISALAKFHQKMNASLRNYISNIDEELYSLLMENEIILFAKNKIKNPQKLKKSDFKDNLYINFKYLLCAKRWQGDKSSLKKELEEFIVVIFKEFKACFDYPKNLKTISEDIATDFFTNEHPPMNKNKIKNLVQNNLISELGLIHNAYIPANDEVYSGNFYGDQYFNYLRKNGSLQVGFVKINSGITKAMLQLSLNKNLYFRNSKYKVESFSNIEIQRIRDRFVSNDKPLKVIDSHTMGEPTRVIVSGIPILKGSNLIEKREYFKDKFDHIRRAVLLEPRGHKDMFGAVLLPASDPSAVFDVIYMDTKGYLNMCIHATIGIVTTIFEQGFIAKSDKSKEITLNTPVGLIRAKAYFLKGKVSKVSVTNIPSYLAHSNIKLKLNSGLNLEVNIAFGGNFAAIIKQSDLDLLIECNNINNLIPIAIEVQDKVNDVIQVEHPYLKHINRVDLAFIYGDASNSHANSRGVAIFSEGSFDRSPCGSGTSAMMAYLHSKGKLSCDEDFTNESIIGTFFNGKIKRLTKVKDYDAIIPEITASAYITSESKIFIDPNDPYKYGIDFSLLK